MLAYIELDVVSICNETGFEKFLAVGSWSSSIIEKVVSDWDRCEELREYDNLKLITNYIDVNNGPSNDYKNATFNVDFHEIKKCKVDGLQWELNTVNCNCLSDEGFHANNDINLTASCFEVNFSKNK